MSLDGSHVNEAAAAYSMEELELALDLMDDPLAAIADLMEDPFSATAGLMEDPLAVTADAIEAAVAGSVEGDRVEGLQRHGEEADAADLDYLQQLEDAFGEPRRLLRKRSSINYDENERRRRNSRTGGRRGDAEEDGSEGGSVERDEDGKPRTKRSRGEGAEEPRRKRDVRESELEKLVAWQVGLNGAALSEEEEEVLPPHIINRQDQYILVRNHILARWRADVGRHLSRDDAGAKISHRHHDLVTAAWDFLDTHGYINFGIGLGARLRPPPGGRGADGVAVGAAAPPPRTVIVVGAGLAGAAAACQLHRWGFRVLVLEGRNRPGGRVYTMPLEGGGCSGAADLGGSIITGTDGNPLAVLARQMQIPMHVISDNTPLYLDGGGEAEAEDDQRAMKQHDAILDLCDQYREDIGATADLLSVGTAFETLVAELPPLEDAAKQAMRSHLLDWHMANMEFASAARLDTLSLRSWNQM